jgi:hypothetical protein
MGYYICMINSLIILLSSLTIGMFIGLIFRKEHEFHGPNASKYSKKIFREGNICYRFVPHRIYST